VFDKGKDMHRLVKATKLEAATQWVLI
jgi:hypothetical protein